MLRCLGLTLAVGAVMLAGCFTDSTAEGGGQTAGDECQEGTATCPCYGNDTCNQGLECIDGRCFAQNCSAGSQDCPCDDDQCDGGLQCDDGVCRPPTTETSSSTTGTTTDPSTTGMPTTTMPLTSGPETEGTTDAPACEVTDADSTCSECAKTMCCGAWNVCEGEEECLRFGQCLNSNADIAGCILDYGPPGPSYDPVEECFASMGECGTSCLSRTYGCIEQPFVSPCIECLSGTDCCDLLALCWSDQDCACMARCLTGALPGTPAEPGACGMACGAVLSNVPTLPELRDCAVNDPVCDNAMGESCL